MSKLFPRRAANTALNPVLPTRLPLLYFGVAHLSLLVALAVVALDPRGVSGFFYHPRMLGVVHLITLGWITGGILGAIHVVAPLVLRVPMPVTRGDYWALAFVTIGTNGMVSHFWIETFSGMAWSAGMVVCGLLHVTIRTLVHLRSARLSGPAAVQFLLACLNLLVAGGAGVLIAIDKVGDVIPGNALSNVYAHAHLAAVGWASMMVIVIGYRLLPVAPRDRWFYGSTILQEVGLVGLVVSLVTGWSGTFWFGLCLVSGLGLSLAQVVWVTGRLRAFPAAGARSDFAVLQAGHALFYLVLTAGCGLVVLGSPLSAWTPSLMMLYGVLGLLGFLAQLVAAMELRLVQLLESYSLDVLRGFPVVGEEVHVPLVESTSGPAFTGWVVGLPVLAIGLALDRPPLVSVGAWVLLVAVAFGTLQATRALRPFLKQFRFWVPGPRADDTSSGHL